MSEQQAAPTAEVLRAISTLVDEAATLGDGKGRVKAEAGLTHAMDKRNKLADLCKKVRAIGSLQLLSSLGINDESIAERLDRALAHAERVERQHNGRGALERVQAMFRREARCIVEHPETLSLLRPDFVQPNPYYLTNDPEEALITKDGVRALITLDITAARLGVVSVLSEEQCMDAFLALPPE